MNETCRLAVFLSCVISCLTASAGNPFHRLLDCQPVPDCIGRWCPDDYCSKKEPCVRVPLCFQCDDYCSKKEPRVCPGLRLTCDDYCKKRLPIICPSPRCDVLNCAPRCSSEHAVAAGDNFEASATIAKLANSSQLPSESAEAVIDGGEFDQFMRAMTIDAPDSDVGE